jgi:hypothetical protein
MTGTKSNQIIFAILFGFVACLLSSCAETAGEPAIVSGHAAPGFVRVSMWGPMGSRNGIYYFTNGTTLETALNISSNFNDFSHKAVILGSSVNGNVKKKRYYVNRLEPAAKAVTLKDGDYLEFPRIFP